MLIAGSFRQSALACALLIASLGAAIATPLGASRTHDPAADAGVARRLSDAELANAAALDARTPGMSDLTESLDHFLGASRPSWMDVAESDQPGSFLHGVGTGSPFDILRSAVVTQPGREAGRRGPSRSQLNLDDPVLGVEAQAWLEDAVRAIVNSAVELRITEQGRTAFSLLGSGEFNIAVSNDRNEIALVSGEDILLSANRTPQFQHTGMPLSERRFAEPLEATAERPRGLVLQEALEAATEMATHPLSLLVYALIAGYALLWQVLASQGQRRIRAAAARSRATPAGASHHRSSSRSGSRRHRRH